MPLRTSTTSRRSPLLPSARPLRLPRHRLHARDAAREGLSRSGRPLPQERLLPARCFATLTELDRQYSSAGEPALLDRLHVLASEPSGSSNRSRPISAHQPSRTHPQRASTLPGKSQALETTSTFHVTQIGGVTADCTLRRSLLRLTAPDPAPYPPHVHSGASGFAGRRRCPRPRGGTGATMTSDAARSSLAADIKVT